MDAAGQHPAGLGAAWPLVAWPLVMGGLALTGLLLIVAGRGTARRPDAAPPDLEGHLARWSSAHADIDPRRSRWVHGWLRLVHAVARPLAARGVHPDVLTWCGWWWAAAAASCLAAGGRWPLLAALLVVAGGVADGLDGAVAVLTDRTSAWGGVLDSFVDRLADWTLLVGLVALGAPVGTAVAAGAALALLEYTRARASAVARDLDVVTVGERPTRIVLVALSAWSAGLLPGMAALIASIGAVAVAAVSLVGVVHLFITAHRELR